MISPPFSTRWTLQMDTTLMATTRTSMAMVPDISFFPILSLICDQKKIIY